VKYKKARRWRYKLERDKHFYLPGLYNFEIDDLVGAQALDTMTHVFVRKGYAWDGATGPVFQTDTTKRASLEHDVALQAIELGLISDECLEVFDKHYRYVAINEGMFKPRAYLHYFAMRYLRPLIWDRLPKRDYDKVYEV